MDYAVPRPTISPDRDRDSSFPSPRNPLGVKDWVKRRDLAPGGDRMPSRMRWAPFGVRVTETPMTPARIVALLRNAGGRDADERRRRAHSYIVPRNGDHDEPGLADREHVRLEVLGAARDARSCGSTAKKGLDRPRRHRNALCHAGAGASTRASGILPMPPPSTASTTWPTLSRSPGRGNLRRRRVIGQLARRVIAAEMAVRSTERLRGSSWMAPLGIKVGDRETRDIPAISRCPLGKFCACNTGIRSAPRSIRRSCRRSAHRSSRATVEATALYAGALLPPIEAAPAAPPDQGAHAPAVGRRRSIRAAAN